MIHATYFTYDNVSSQTYNLHVADFTDITPDPIEEREAVAVELTTLSVPQNVRFFYGGTQPSSPPTMELTVVSEDVLSTGTIGTGEQDRVQILRWLMNRNGFKELKFYGSDLSDVSFYCVFTNASLVYVNGECHGIRLTATLNSQYAVAENVVTSKTCYGTMTTVTITQRSATKDSYSYPTVEFTGNIKIQNSSDDNRVFEFQTSNQNEEFTVDCENKIITSSVQGENLSKFISKKWLRLVDGENRLEITASGDVTITVPQYVMIGR